MADFNLNDLTSRAQRFLENEYVTTTLGLFLVIYGSLAAPKLPPSIARLFENPLFRLVILFLIAYMSSKNPSIALISAVALTVSLQTLSKHQMNGALMGVLQQEQAMPPAPVVMPAAEEEAFPEEAIPEEVMEEVLAEANGNGNGNGNGSMYPSSEDVVRYLNANYYSSCNDDNTPVEAVVPNPTNEGPDPENDQSLYAYVEGVQGYDGGDYAHY